MRTSLVLAILGDDKPGIVEQLSERIVATGANWAHDSTPAAQPGRVECGHVRRCGNRVSPAFLARSTNTVSSGPDVPTLDTRTLRHTRWVEQDTRPTARM